MKYSGMPAVMWFLYRKSFQMALVNDLKKSPEEARRIMVKVKPKYKEIISKLPEFEKGDRFKANIVNCAILISCTLETDERLEDPVSPLRQDEIIALTYRIHKELITNQHHPVDGGC